MPDAIPVPPEAVKHVDPADFSQQPGPDLAALDAAMQATEGMRQWSLFPRPSVRAQILHAALKAARPLIAAAERTRILVLLDAWSCSCGADDCAAYDTRDQIASLIGDTR